MQHALVWGSAGLIEQFSSAFEKLGAAWVLWLLIGLSVVSVAIMLERAVFFATRSLGDVDDLCRKLATGDLQGAARQVEKRQGLEVEVIRRGIEAAPQGAEAVDEVIRSTMIRERLRYERFLSFLGTLGNNAPFVGLFGTVLGIISAFAELAKTTKSGSMTSGSSNIMAGISEALVATAVGLLVALPAVAVYNLFQRWLKTISARAEALGHALAAHLKSHGSEGRAE